MHSKAKRHSPICDWSALYALKPLGTLWLDGYWLSAIPVKVKVGMTRFDFCTTLPTGTTIKCQFFTIWKEMGWPSKN